jgi:hypothetical protein
MTTTTLDWSTIRVGDRDHPMTIDVTATVVVAGAIATRDFMPVHHDRDYANSQGAPNIFMNIMTDNGLLQPLPHGLGRARRRWCEGSRSASACRPRRLDARVTPGP